MLLLQCFLWFNSEVS